MNRPRNIPHFAINPKEYFVKTIRNASLTRFLLNQNQDYLDQGIKLDLRTKTKTKTETGILLHIQKQTRLRIRRYLEMGTRFGLTNLLGIYPILTNSIIKRPIHQLHYIRVMMQSRTRARGIHTEAGDISKNFIFALGASGKPKAADVPTIPLKPKVPYSSIQVGEDSFFTRHDSMGVADGVGGWAEIKGANPALYSLKLMHYCKYQLDQYDNLVNESEYSFELQDYAETTPKEILKTSYIQTNIDSKIERIVGSTTAIVLILRANKMRVTNIGDCGVMVIRAGVPVFRNEEQQHSFNFPFQLGTSSRDTPESTQNFNITVQEGDIVVVGSDGLFDNVFDEDIVDIVASKTMSSVLRSDPQEMADSILRRACEVSEDSRFASSPFQTRAIKEGFYYQGGKVDDITVLVGIIQEEEDSPDRR